ncbi:hypothetical protein ACFXOY_05895 [Streptomyces niveus]
MQFVVHEQPVGRTSSNYIARVDLAPFGLGGQKDGISSGEPLVLAGV